MPKSPHPFFSLFDDPGAWQVVASGQAQGRLSAITGAQGQRALRLDYNFHGGGGFVVMRRDLRCTLPETFEIGWWLRGHGPSNHFEFKVACPDGANVWRHACPDFALPDDWGAVRITERDLPFAWGPAGGGAPGDVGAVEFVIAAGPGGAGVLELSGASMEDQTPGTPRAIHASSHQSGTAPEAVLSAASLTDWHADSNDPAPWWAVDFGRPVRFGGLVVDWPAGLPSRDFSVEISHDGDAWETVFGAACARGARSHIPVPAAEARHLRLRFGHAACAALRTLTLRPDAFSCTPNEFIHSVARDFPRGWFPRYWHREQSYWTPVGSPEGKRRALINEEGMVEVDEAGFSLEPFVLLDGKLITWADVQCTRSLAAGGAPLPAVTWKSARVRLDILPWVDGKDRCLTLHVTYRLKCRQPAAGARLVVTVRPYQVNPPWQAFRNLGGRSPIHQILCSPDGLRVGQREVVVSAPADAAGAAAFEEGGVLAFLANNTLPPSRKIEDASGLASGALAWMPGEGNDVLEVTVSVPYYEQVKNPGKRGRATALARWRKTLGAVHWQVPPCAVPAFDCFRTAAAHILIHRDGPAIQPGPRRYTRSWIRDCVIMGAALTKAGLPHALREFLIWYAQFQRADGFVPCVVDRDGVDWLVEHDSHGQFLWGLREVWRAGGDLRLVERLFPQARQAADYLLVLRAQRMSGDYQTGEHAACFGLLPESASHEGYLAHPVHAYWDDFWGVRGLEAAAELAGALGLTADARRWQREGENFQHDLLVSIDKVIAGKQLAYIPGSVEWADFDPTATANAIAQLDFADVLPATPLSAMLVTYLDGFRRRHGGQMPWVNYSAYEIRLIGAFVRLGKRDEANELLEFFLSDRRPAEWNQWPEITWRDSLSPGHLGDVPHTWIAAEFLLALASMVASERESGVSLVLASGMPWAWISGDPGFVVNGLPTRFGLLDFSISAPHKRCIQIAVGGALTLPPGGLSIVPPLPAGQRILRATGSNGTSPAIDSTGTSIAVDAIPFQSTLHLGPGDETRAER